MSRRKLRFEVRLEWKIWVVGFGLDLEMRTAGLCLGPVAVWLSWR